MINLASIFDSSRLFFARRYSWGATSEYPLKVAEPEIYFAGSLLRGQVQGCRPTRWTRRRKWRRCLFVYAGSGSISGCDLGGNIGDGYYTAGQRTDKSIPFAWKIQYSNGTVVEQQMAYNNWAPDEQNDPGDSCLAIGASTQFNYQWFDAPCTFEICLLCEIDPWRPPKYDCKPID